MIANPIIQRELVALLRTRKAVAIQLLLLAGLSMLVWFLWPTNALVNLDGRQAKQLFQVFAYGLLVGLLLLAPVFPATSIVRERRARTLELLLTSRLDALSILFGKVIASIGFVLLMLVVSLPPAAACYAMGGIDPYTQILPTYGVLCLVAIQYAMIGLLVSSFSKSTDGAMRTTYMVVLGLGILTIIPGYMFGDSSPVDVMSKAIPFPIIEQAVQSVYAIPFFWPLRLVVVCVCGGLMLLRPKWLNGTGPFVPLNSWGMTVQITLAVIILIMCTDADWLRTLSPIPALMERLGQGEAGQMGREAQQGVTVMYAINSVAIILTCVAALYQRLRPALLDVARASATATEERSDTEQWYRRIMFLWFFDPNRRTGAIGDWTNPVMAKEFRSRAFGRSHWTLRLIASCLIISMLLALAATFTQHQTGVGSSTAVSKDYLGGVLALFQISLVLLVAPALSASLISSELEVGSWQLLQVTRLRPIQIVVGKLMSSVWTVALLLFATIPGYLVLLWIDPSLLWRVLDVVSGLGLTALFAVLLGAACSSLFQKTTAATAITYLVMVVLCVATLVPWLGEGTFFSRGLVEQILVVNPVAAVLSVIQMPGLAQYNLATTNWQFLGIASAVCVAVLWIRTWQLTRPQ